VTMVQTLMREGLAYQSGGNVYFSIRRYPSYGQLSRLRYEEMLPIANRSGNDPADPHKRDPLDFPLWQQSAPGEPSWNSPWGPGRPGWHIECSAMSTKYLGPQVDIHGGGSDLIFPHHESEIAQSEPCTHVHPFVRYWVHTGMVGFRGEKMSKSLGNLVMVREVLKQVPADALRLYLLGFHYRQSWTYEDAGLAPALPLAAQIRQAATPSIPSVPGARGLDPAPWQERFQKAMDDDLDTPKAITALRALAAEIVDSRGRRVGVKAAQRALSGMAEVLGLNLQDLPPFASAG